jgi:hypothetical protein
VLCSSLTCVMSSAAVAKVRVKAIIWHHTNTYMKVTCVQHDYILNYSVRNNASSIVFYERDLYIRIL